MRKIYSSITPDLLLHIIYRKSEMEAAEGRVEIVEPDNFIQVCSLNLEAGKTFRPHKHIWKPGCDMVIAQESWVIIEGHVRLFLFDTDGSQVAYDELGPGDISVTLEGGHTYEAVGHALVYEYKTGPYTGQKDDKVFFDD